jgi:hypothetical protein
MFDFLFGGKRKLELIRELTEQRMREVGFDDMHHRIQVKQLSNLQLISTPEGTIVTILESVLKMQRQGLLLVQILNSIESHRRSTGHDPNTFAEIIALARGQNAGDSVPMYVLYRVNLEAPGRMTEDQVFSAMNHAMQILTT